MFWFFGHPEVYIIIVPVFGIVSHVVSSVVNSSSIFSYLAMGFAVVSISFVGFVV
jgi:heme/copper-type cytochrome/quinol oxidase subunit 1